MEAMILDTNVLIEILKNNPDCIQTVESIKPPLYISIISAMELLYGARNKQELKKLQQFLTLFDAIPLTPNISTSAYALIANYAKSHKLDIPDALIAATCIDANQTLFTYNIKDFKYIPKLTLF
jgi:tRNA(fMet)-specific endonuclease VapC